MTPGTNRSATWYQRPGYVALERSWYGKLRDAGFVDIEQPGDFYDRKLAQNWIKTVRTAVRGAVTGAAEWFRMAYTWLDLAQYRTRGERLAYAAFVDGWSQLNLHNRFPVVFSVFAVTEFMKRQDAEMRAYKDEPGE